MASLFVAFLALFLVGLTCANSPAEPQIIDQQSGGDFGGARDADAGIQKLVDGVANDIRNQAKPKLPPGTKLTARRYISQVVSGTNYVVEIQAGTGRSAKVIHAVIYEPLFDKVEVQGVKTAVIGQALELF